MEHEGHRARLRERYEKEGLDRFELHNLLELLLFYAIPRKDTNEIAHRLEEKFHSLSAILEAPEEELRQVEGIGAQAASFLHLIPQICRKYMSDVLEPGDHIIDSTEKACNLLSARMIGYDHEVVILLLLSSVGKIRCCDTIAEGNLNSADVDLRKIMAMSIKYKASKAILAHNHPNGVALPSREDLDTTRRIAETLRVGGTQLIDHIIVADGDCVSLAESGLLSGLDSAAHETSIK